MAKAKDHRIDNLRAIAILFVVFGHSIILYQNDWTLFATQRKVPFLNIVKEMIDVIQMPLFISLSGYLFNYSCPKTSLTELVKKKVLRLGIPYLCIGIGWMLPIRLITKYSGYQNMSLGNIILHKILMCEDNGHLWFLPFIFMCFIIMYFLVKTTVIFRLRQFFANLFLIVTGLVVYLEWWRIPSDILFGSVFRSVGIWYFWFPFGYLLNSYKDMISQGLSRYRYLILIGSFMLMIAYIIGIHPYIFLTRVLLLISLYLVIPDRYSKMSEFLSNNSFGTYLFHSPLVYLTFAFIPNAWPVAVVTLNFFVFGGIAVYMTRVISKTECRFLIGG